MQLTKIWFLRQLDKGIKNKATEKIPCGFNR